MPKPLNLVGQVFGRITVNYRFPENNRGRSVWIGTCACGNTVKVIGAELMYGRIKSCGCLRDEIMQARIERMRIPAKAEYPQEYQIWKGMRKRCPHPDARGHRYYASRGITIDPRWNTFTNFIQDMGARPSPQHSLERVDNSKGYTPENVIWATQTTQCRNKRTNHLLTFHGETHCVAEWSAITGVPYRRILSRLSRGWSTEKTLTLPKRY